MSQATIERKAVELYDLPYVGKVYHLYYIITFDADAVDPADSTRFVLRAGPEQNNSETLRDVVYLDGDGVELINFDQSTAFFDIDNDGNIEHTGWVSAADGLLVRDTNANGVIDDITEVLSP